MTLFPSIQPQLTEMPTLPLYREIKWDFENDVPVFRGGAPVIVEGAEAVLVWAWKALRTPRFRYEIYTWEYGNDAEQLVGKPFSEEVKRAEAARYVRECLLVNPYITGVKDLTVTFDSERLRISAKIITVYGEVNVNV